MDNQKMPVNLKFDFCYNPAVSPIEFRNHEQLYLKFFGGVNEENLLKPLP